MITFKTNQPETSKTYIKRPGVYGIIPNEQNLLAIVKTPRGYFLPGGGIEGSESETECLVRECLEEIGIKVKVLEKICSGDCYFYATTSDKYIESLGHFYTCEIETFSHNKTEADHELVWLDPQTALASLYLDNQKQAIKIFLDLARP
jgi:8-oxo-dGTP diphosphatase